MSSAEMITSPRPHLLLVEDDEQLSRALSRSLATSYAVTAVSSAERAVRLLAEGSFDVILSDVHLGGADGVEFLRSVRAVDAGIPVLLMTGEPSIETAVQAVEFGASRYLVKPLDVTQVRAALEAAVSVRRAAQATGQSCDVLRLAPGSAGGDDAAASVDAAIQSLRVAWQPIVSWSRRRVVGYEALMRSRLATPIVLIDAAWRCGRGPELGRTLRAAVAEAAELAPAPDLYVNVHPHELRDEQLYDPDAPLSRIASRVILEITERVPLESVADLPVQILRLRKLGFRLALDDLGAGYAGLISLAKLEPEVVKVDLGLVRDIHHSPKRQQLVSFLVAACRDLGCSLIAEGVELPAERDTLVGLGFDLLQGFLFAQPGTGFAAARF